MTENDPNLRASDADREAVAARLRAADEDGRLDTDELEERLARAYAAKTFGDLEPLTVDLARPVAPAPPAPAPAPEVAPSDGGGSLLSNWRAWAGTAVLTIGIWGILCLVSGSLLFFWPIFPIGFWGLSLIATTVSGSGRRS